MNSYIEFSNKTGLKTPQYDDSQTKGPEIIAAGAVSLTLAILSTTARVFARRRVQAPLKTDDYLIFVATIMAVGVVAATQVMMHYGLGRHIDMVTDPQGLAKAVVAAQITYALSVIPIKLSILALYHRLFPAPKLKWACYILGGVVIAYSVTLAICMGLQCIPLDHIWDPDVPAECMDADVMFTIMAVVNVSTDFLILGLPIPYIWRLSLQKARKVQLLAVFLLGALVCAFGIVRSVAVGTASIQDQSWSDVDGGIWSEVEICIGVLSANLPCLRPLFFWLPTNMRGSTNTNPKDANTTTGPSRYGNGTKRQSAHGGMFEMKRKSRITNDRWEELDAESDIQPLARRDTIHEDAKKHEARCDNRAESRQNNYVARGAREQNIETLGKGIVVETKIETNFEDSASSSTTR